MKQMKLWVLTVTLVCGTMTFMTGCKEAKANEDNPVEKVSSEELIRELGRRGIARLSAGSS